jgi:hypothetical protein
MEDKDNVLDLEEVKRRFKEEHLNEALADAMSWWTSTLLKATYGSRGIELPFRLAGSRDEISALIAAMGLERRYIADAHRYGLDNPVTYKTRSVLQNAIQKFESRTGLPWPFKN